MTGVDALPVERVPLEETGTTSRRDLVVATSTQGGSLQRTVHAKLASANMQDYEDGDLFLRKVWALLVLQYLAILFLVSPFCLVQSFQKSIEPFHAIMEIVAISGIAASFCLSLVKGPIWPFAHIALVSLTCFVSLEIGLSLAGKSWGVWGLIAIGQANTSFAVLSSLLQLRVVWISYVSAAVVCLGLTFLWMLVLLMTGASTVVSVSVALGGWTFFLIVLWSCDIVTKHVAPEEYVLAVLFILCPEALLFLATKKRHPADEGETETLLVTSIAPCVYSLKY